MIGVKLCGKDLRTPLILGSGTLGENKENLISALKYGAGGVVPRTLRLQNSGRKLFNPAYYISKDYMLNADNQNVTPWDYWLDKVGEIEKYGRMIISLSVRNPDDCKTIIPAFERNNPPSFYEFNFSCPHSAKLYGEITYKSAEEALKIARKETDQPLLLKLSLGNIDIGKLKYLEEKKLIDALVVSNSVGPGMRINVKTGKPYLESAVGGVSGKAIKPLVLGAIYDMKQYLRTPIIGVGGIESAEDVLEYMILGCEAVQIYTAAHVHGLRVFGDIKKGLEKSAKGNDIKNFKGTLKLWK